MGAKGSGIVKSVDSTTQLTLVGATGLTAEGSLTQSYNLSEQPKYLVHDTNYGADDEALRAAIESRIFTREYPLSITQTISSETRSALSGVFGNAKLADDGSSNISKSSLMTSSSLRSLSRC